MSEFYIRTFESEFKQETTQDQDSFDEFLTNTWGAFYNVVTVAKMTGDTDYFNLTKYPPIGEGLFRVLPYNLSNKVTLLDGSPITIYPFYFSNYFWENAGYSSPNSDYTVFVYRVCQMFKYNLPESYTKNNVYIFKFKYSDTDYYYFPVCYVGNDSNYQDIITL
jgi:hypothetical protein